MPRYYLHYGNGELLRDEVGQELAGDDEAKAAVRVAAAELIGEQIALGNRVDWSNRIFVERDGKLIMVFEFSRLIDRAPKSSPPSIARP